MKKLTGRSSASLATSRWTTRRTNGRLLWCHERPGGADWKGDAPVVKSIEADKKAAEKQLKQDSHKSAKHKLK